MDEEVDWTNPQASLDWMAGMLVRRHKSIVVEQLQKARIPPGVRKQLWGGGVRLAKIRSDQLRGGLRNGIRTDDFVSKFVARLWLRLNGDVSDRVLAAVRWSSLVPTLDGDPWPFLVGRAQPTLDLLVAMATVERETLPVHSLSGRKTKDHRIVIGAAPPEKPEAILDDFRARRDWLVLETLGSQVSESPGDEPLRTTFEALVRGDSAAADAAYARVAEQEVEGPVAVSLKGLVDLEAGRHVAALAGVRLVREQAVLRHTAMLHAQLALEMGEPLEAVRALLRDPHAPHSLRIFPLRLVWALSVVVGLKCPEGLGELVQEPWVAPEDRRAAAQAMQAILDANETSTVSPSGRPTGEGRALDPVQIGRLKELEDAASEYRGAEEQLRSATERQDWSTVASLSSHLEELGSRLDDLIAAVNGHLGDERALSPPDPSILRSEVEFAAWSKRVAGMMAARTRAAAEALDLGKAELEREMAAAEVEPPPTLASVESLSELEVLRGSLLPDLIVGRASVRAREEGHLGAELLDGMAPELRLRVLQRVATDLPAGPTLAFLTADASMRRADESAAVALALVLLERLLEAGGTIPPGTLRFIAVSSDARRRMAGILEQVDSEEQVPVEELAEAYASETDLLPDRLAHRVRVSAILGRPVDDPERVGALAKLLRDEPLSGDIRRGLFDTLVALGRHGEAVYLVMAAGRLSGEPIPGPELRNAVLRLVLADRIWRSRSCALASLVSDSSWWLERVDTTLVLLLLLRRLDRNDDIINLQFAQASEIDAARARHPKLAAVLLNGPPPVVPAGVLDAREAMAEFRRDLARESCFTAWQNASNYQLHFRQVLEAVLVAVREGEGNALERSVEEIIDGAGGALPKAEGTARRAFVRFLDDQFARLRIVYQALQAGSTLEQLEHSPCDWQEELREEADRSAPGFPLDIAYKRAMGFRP